MQLFEPITVGPTGLDQPGDTCGVVLRGGCPGEPAADDVALGPHDLGNLSQLVHADRLSVSPDRHHAVKPTSPFERSAVRPLRGHPDRRTRSLNGRGKEVC